MTTQFSFDYRPCIRSTSIVSCSCLSGKTEPFTYSVLEPCCMFFLAQEKVDRSSLSLTIILNPNANIFIFTLLLRFASKNWKNYLSNDESIVPDFPSFLLFKFM